MAITTNTSGGQNPTNEIDGDQKTDLNIKDLLAAASLSTPQKLTVNNNDSNTSKTTKSTSKSTYSSSSSNSSSCSSHSSSGGSAGNGGGNSGANQLDTAHNTTLYKANLRRNSNFLGNSNTNIKRSSSKSQLSSSSKTKLTSPDTSSNLSSSALNFSATNSPSNSTSTKSNITATTSATSIPTTKHSQTPVFNIENELIKYTKNLKNSKAISYETTYKLGTHIRNGGFSEIYEGDSIAVATQPVIIKLIPKHKTKNWLMVHSKKYPAEILLHKMCNHVSGVVKMLEFYEQDHEWIIIMPKLANCMDLFDYLESKQRGRLTELEAANFFVQLIQINLNLLAQGVVHRDIKSENLLVDLDTMKLVLIDFGASAIHRNFSIGQGGTVDPNVMHHYTDFHGTRQYKPPEYIKYKKYTAQASTVWALGILLYDMCNGQLPFETEQEILEYNLVVKSNMSEDYKKILFDCLKVEPTQRPSLSQLLEYSWCLKFTNDNNVSSSETTTSTSTTNTLKSNKKSTKSNS